MTTHLNIISAGAALGLVRSLLADQVTIKVGANFGAVGVMYDHFVSGVPCDLLVLTRKQLLEMEAAGVLIAGTVTDLGHVKTGVAVSVNAQTSPAIGDEASLKASLLAASSLFTPDTKQSTAGQHVASIIDKLGIKAQMAGKISEHPNGATAMRVMGESKDAAAIGCTQVTEILYTPSVRLVGLLPKEFELSTVYSIAVPKRSTDPEAAKAAITKLCGAANQGVRQAAGFDAS
jgi:molybdate transport system substrate-binding protein